MALSREEVFKMLREKQVAYRMVAHPAVFTMEEMEKLGLGEDTQAVAKNLFLRDDKKRNYYLAVIKGDKRVDLKELRKTIQSRPLSFASQEELDQYLGLKAGSVTPLGILNDTERKVAVFIDQDFQGGEIAVNPERNTATLWMRTEDLKRIIELHGNQVSFIRLDP